MNPVALVVGASRGMGRQIAIDLALNGYTVVLAAKSTSVDKLPDGKFTPPDPNSRQSTIHTVCGEIKAFSPSAVVTPLAVDVRSPASIQSLIDQTIAIHSRIDVLVYNAGAIHWGTVASTPLKRYNLLQQINPDGLYATVQACLPHFERQGWKGKVIVVCPPIYQRFFRGKVGYAMGKVGMSVLVKGLGMEWEEEGRKDMSICGIWPASAIESAATTQFTDEDESRRNDLRKPTVFSHAILALLAAPNHLTNALLTTDEDVLRAPRPLGLGYSEDDMLLYSLVTDSSGKGVKTRRIMPKVFPDLTVEEENLLGVRMDSDKARSRRNSRGAKL